MKNTTSAIIFLISIFCYALPIHAILLTIENKYRAPIELSINDKTVQILEKGGGKEKSRYSAEYPKNQLLDLAKTIKIRQKNSLAWHRGIRNEIEKNINKAGKGIIIFIEDTTNIIHFAYDTFAYNSITELRDKIINSRKK